MCPILNRLLICGQSLCRSDVYKSCCKSLPSAYIPTFSSTIFDITDSLIFDYCPDFMCLKNSMNEWAWAIKLVFIRQHLFRRSIFLHTRHQRILWKYSWSVILFAMAIHSNEHLLKISDVGNGICSAFVDLNFSLTSMAQVQNKYQWSCQLWKLKSYIEWLSCVKSNHYVAHEVT